MSPLRKIKRRRGQAGRLPAQPATSSDGPERIELQMTELEAILARAKSSLSQEEYDKLHAAIETLLFVTQELEKKRVSVKRLKQMLFGASTEKLSKILDEALGQDEKDKNKDKGQQNSQSDTPEKDKPKPKGHGRNGADAYTGADKITIPHATLKPGDCCPNCGNCPTRTGSSSISPTVKN